MTIAAVDMGRKATKTNKQKVIVDNEGCTPDEYECLNTQVGMWTADGEVFKILVILLFQYITVIVDNEGCTSD